MDPTSSDNSIVSPNTLLNSKSPPNENLHVPDAVHINVPSSGSVQIVDVQNAKEVVFNFDLKSVRVTAIDVDLVLLFSDNSKLILPGLAMDLLGSNAPRLKSLNKLVDAQDVVAAISQVNLAESTPSVHLASTDFIQKKQGGNSSDDKTSADGNDPGEVAPATNASQIITPVRPSAVSDKTGNATGAKVESIEAGSIASSRSSLSSAAGEPPSIKTPPSSGSSQSTSAAKGNSPFTMQAAELTIKALAIASTSETNQSSGKTIIGGSGSAAAATDDSFAAQSSREMLEGGSGNDVIYADDPRFSANGMAGRLLDVTVTMPISGITMTRAIISGIPTGYSILNAQMINGSWEVPIDPTKPNNFQLQLVYKIPDDSQRADANGFYDRFTMSIVFNGTDKTGTIGTISGAATIGIRDVNSAGDENFIDPISGRPVVVLSRMPAGNEIHAGQGNDTIYAAAGADSIDGGEGSNRVTYVNSQSGVNVNLASGSGDGGFAEGDTYNKISAVDGSKFNDTLIGDINDNTLIGGSGADSIDGGAGANRIDYSASTSGVSINLQTGRGTGGDAQGDTLINIQQVIGSNSNDLLIAGPSGTTLFGGKGDDTIASGQSADSLDGGEGNNTLDYRNSIGGVTLNLATHFANGGDAQGDKFSNFENLTGSGYGDSLIGDEFDNVIDGQGGNDTILGAGGNDTLSAGAGSDTLDGGAGNDTLDYSYVVSSGIASGSGGITLTLNGATTANVTGLIATDQDKISNIEHVIGTSFDDSITGDSNANSLFGADGNDTLVGSGNNDTLDGGLGNDCLIGTTGSDIMRGGGGHDYMLIDQSFLGGSGSIDGGAGSDTLNFASNSGDLTLTSGNFSNVITNVEMLDFTAVGTNVTMSLNATDIGNLTGKGLGSSTTLEIFQNSGDSISIATQAGYSVDTDTSNGVTTYTIYNDTDPHTQANQLAQLIVH